MADDAAESLAIAPSTDVGSERLAAALAAMDVPGIARALRHDYIIVPLMRGPEGETQTRVLEAPDPEGDRRWSLCLFSSTAGIQRLRPRDSGARVRDPDRRVAGPVPHAVRGPAPAHRVRPGRAAPGARLRGGCPRCAPAGRVG